MLVISGGNAAAAGRKISQTLPLTATITSVEYTPDGRWISYLADIDVDNRLELYVIDREGNFLNQKVNVGNAAGTVRLLRRFDHLLLYTVGQQLDNRLYASTLPLNAPVELTPLTGGVSSWQVTNAQVNVSQSTVVFQASQTLNGAPVNGFLYSVPLSGGPVTQLNAPLDTPTQTVTRFSFLNDTEVIYQTGSANGSSKLYRARLDGTSVAQISLPSSADSDVSEYEISSSGQYVVYRGDLLMNEKFEVFTTHLPTLAIERISADIAIERDVIQFELFEDADRVVYELGQDFVGPPVLRTRSLVVNDDIALAGSPEFRNLSLTNAAAGRVIYTRLFNSTLEFRSTPVNGGIDVSLAFPFTGTARYQVISPQSGFVALGLTRLTSRRELFINRPNGSGLVPLTLGNFSAQFFPEFTIDDAALTFSQVDGNVHELISYDTASQVRQVLDRVDQFGKEILYTRPSPVDSDEVVYVKDEQSLFDQFEIWLVSRTKIFSDSFE